MKAVLLALLLVVTACVAAPRARALCLINCSCDVSASALSFGIFDPMAGTASSAIGQINVSCAGLAGLAVTNDILLSTGQAGSFNRAMRNANGDGLFYNLYTSAAYSNIWGDGTSGAGMVSRSFVLTLGGYTYSAPVYGRIPAAPVAKPGAYADTIVVTLIF